MEPDPGKSRPVIPGSAPGTLRADPDAPKPEIQVITYGPVAGPDGMQRTRVDSIDALPAMPTGHEVFWVDITGLGDLETIRKVGERFGLHPLALEDVLNVHQRPKAEEYEEHLFVVTRMPDVSPGRPAEDAHGSDHADETPAAGGAPPGRLATEQLSICIGPGFVVTFQETPGDVFEPVRERIRKGNGRIRRRGSDYLAYALVDAAIDSFFPLLESYGERVDELEEAVVHRPAAGHVAHIHELKRELLAARRTVWPQREMLNTLMREESPFVEAETRIFLRDCYDHTIQLMDMIETYREITSGLIDVQLSSVSNRMNDVMRVLTMIATIFIPLTFIAGVYGMNFDPEAGPWSMPELDWRYGYPAILAVMAATACALLFWFRRKGWLGRGRGGG